MSDMGNPIRFLAVALVVVLLTAACSGSPSAPDTSGNGPGSEVPTVDRASPEPKGNRASAWRGPNFTIDTFDGATFELAAQAGKPVVINFWESW